MFNLKLMLELGGGALKNIKKEVLKLTEGNRGVDLTDRDIETVSDLLNHLEVLNNTLLDISDIIDNTEDCKNLSTVLNRYKADIAPKWEP